MVSSLSSPISASKKLRGPSYSTMALTSQESETPAQGTPTLGFSSTWPAWSNCRPSSTARTAVSRSWPTTARSHGSSAGQVGELGPRPSPRAPPAPAPEGVILPGARGLCSASAERARHSREVTGTLSPADEQGQLPWALLTAVAVSGVSSWPRSEAQASSCSVNGQCGALLKGKRHVSLCISWQRANKNMTSLSESDSSVRLFHGLLTSYPLGISEN